MNGSASNDPNFDFMTYHWSFVQVPAGSQVKLTAPGTTTASFQADVTGNYVVRLIVNDGQVESTPVTVTITALGKFTKTETISPSRIGGHTATPLPNGNILIVGGYGETQIGGGVSISGDMNSSAIYNATTGKFVASGNLSMARSGHTATLLTNGKILITGGITGPENFAELYDPATGTFVPTGKPNLSALSRTHHTATLLPNGKVLIVGSWSTDPSTASELYDPDAGKFTPTKNQASLRLGHTATLLANGKVLIVGGTFGPQSSSAEIYDPTTDSFSFTGSLHNPRYNHTAVLLSNNKVLIVGREVTISPGIGLVGIEEIYDPVTGKFTEIEHNLMPKYSGYYSGYTTTLLQNGMVLLTGGRDYATNNRAELYDPINNNFVFAGTLKVGRSGHTATLLQNNQVLIVGGGGSSGSMPELYSY